MSKKDEIKNKKNEESKRVLENSHPHPHIRKTDKHEFDTDRRKVIKKSMQLAAAAYVAPVTLQLLTATRATAQSAEPADPIPCGDPLYLVPVRINFVPSSSIDLLENPWTGDDPLLLTNISAVEIRFRLNQFRCDGSLRLTRAITLQAGVNVNIATTASFSQIGWIELENN